MSARVLFGELLERRRLAVVFAVLLLVSLIAPTVVAQESSGSVGRPVYVKTHDGTRIVTISDRQVPDDRHYRVEAPHHVPTSALVDVITSIPAFVAATDPRAAR